MRESSPIGIRLLSIEPIGQLSFVEDVNNGESVWLRKYMRWCCFMDVKTPKSLAMEHEELLKELEAGLQGGGKVA